MLYYNLIRNVHGTPVVTQGLDYVDLRTLKGFIWDVMRRALKCGMGAEEGG